MIKAFEFEDEGRTFSCVTEISQFLEKKSWWWFSLDGVKTTRYAPFPASPDDTQQSVKDRVIAFYAELQAIKARPARDRTYWQKSKAPETQA